MAPLKSEWVLPIVIALLSLAVSGWASYTSNDKELTARVSVVENQQKNDTGRLERIESKVDQIYRYLMKPES